MRATKEGKVFTRGKIRQFTTTMKVIIRTEERLAVKGGGKKNSATNVRKEGKGNRLTEMTKTA